MKEIKARIWILSDTGRTHVWRTGFYVLDKEVARLKAYLQRNGKQWREIRYYEKHTNALIYRESNY